MQLTVAVTAPPGCSSDVSMVDVGVGADTGQFGVGHLVGLGGGDRRGEVRGGLPGGVSGGLVDLVAGVGEPGQTAAKNSRITTRGTVRITISTDIDPRSVSSLWRVMTAAVGGRPRRGRWLWRSPRGG